MTNGYLKIFKYWRQLWSYNCLRRTGKLNEPRKFIHVLANWAIGIQHLLSPEKGQESEVGNANFTGEKQAYYRTLLNYHHALWNNTHVIILPSRDQMLRVGIQITFLVDVQGAMILKLWELNQRLVVSSIRSRYFRVSASHIQVIIIQHDWNI